jgi:metal-responsive CopG/Arc/MetJ family transcriptional regulator
MALPKNTESISISLPSWLLELVDEYCEYHTQTRSSFIQLSVTKYLLLKKASPRLWDHIYHNMREGS